ncbi:hypothetical protein ATE84_1051 [Aquimarina sp. MAR_2010_214]|uniref:hypothetical protein n=1 Tax=Aquimarina sp. MAR_2010_214 TaxID=1250026 RepID=UPI000C703B91|nr:hypothetical protein [Aquimarina sp. MAR_2010_214]PKV49035.1 hypothetical protein ATE84_1051 [Aquimarina sp. MAR_2010_214]
MKKILQLLLLITFNSLLAQTDGLTYQAVILDKNTQQLPGQDVNGNVLVHADILLRFTIMRTASSETEFQETHQVKTDAFGMINLVIGQGQPTSEKSFNAIVWDGKRKDLLVEINQNGDFETLSNQQLLFTPYAFHRDIIATGDMKVSGKSIFSGNTEIDGDIILKKGLYVIDGNLSHLSGELMVDGITNLNNDLNVNNENSTNLSGTLHVDKNTTLKDSLDVEGNTTLSTLIVRSDKEVTDGDSNAEHIALFESNAGGNADGIAIRINNETLSFRNRFITFYGKDDYVAGRIESYDLLGGDLWESFPVPDFNTLFNVFDFDSVLTGGRLPSLAFNNGSLPNANFRRGSLPSLDINFAKFDFDFGRGSLPSLSFNPGSLPTSDFDIGEFPSLNFDGFFDPEIGLEASDQIGAMIGWGAEHNLGFLPLSPWSIAMASIVIPLKQVASNQGIIYGSKGADYAEWLEKQNPTDTFVFGEVVGIKGGKISKNTKDADHVLTISANPIVLGNMPDKNEQKNYEKVGFMGQVPALVAGKVAIGDFIVASGNNDGYSIAIAEKDIEVKDLKNIIGRAWSASNNSLVNRINVSVGLKTNEWITILKKQETEILKMKETLSKVEKLSEKIEKLEIALESIGVN